MKYRKFLALFLCLTLLLPAASTLGTPAGNGDFYPGLDPGANAIVQGEVVYIPIEAFFQAAADAMGLNSADPGFVALMAQNAIKTARAQGVPVSRDAQTAAELLNYLSGYDPMTSKVDSAAQNSTPVNMEVPLYSRPTTILAPMLLPALQAARDKAKASKTNHPMIDSLDGFGYRFGLSEDIIGSQAYKQAFAANTEFASALAAPLDEQLDAAQSAGLLDDAAVGSSPIAGLGIRYAFTEDFFGTLGYKYQYKTGNHQLMLSKDKYSFATSIDTNLARTLFAPLSALHDATQSAAIEEGLMEGAGVRSFAPARKNACASPCEIVPDVGCRCP